MLDGLTVNHPAVSAVIALLEPVVKRELAYYADETTWDEYPEYDVPLRLLGDEVLMDATWAIVGDDSLASVLACLSGAWTPPSTRPPAGEPDRQGCRRGADPRLPRPLRVPGAR